eukprot:GEMP01064433.1.p1 GENE.GEMP01064433.1~~GEMP01064433.1.p1  ORF type:complete len:285 (+),score=47.25 GEMP01064433.1:144-998(+)
MTSAPTTCPKEGGCPAQSLKRLDTTGWATSNLEIICSRVIAVDGSANSGTRMTSVKFDVPTYDYCCLDDNVLDFALCSKTPSALQAKTALKSLNQKADSASSNVTIAIVAVVVLLFLVLLSLVFIMYKRLKTSQIHRMADDKASSTSQSRCSRLTGVTIEQNAPRLSTSQPTIPAPAQEAAMTVGKKVTLDENASVVGAENNELPRKKKSRKSTVASATSADGSPKTAVKRKSSKSTGARIKKESFTPPQENSTDIGAIVTVATRSSKARVKKASSKRKMLDVV